MYIFIKANVVLRLSRSWSFHYLNSLQDGECGCKHKGKYVIINNSEESDGGSIKYNIIV